MNYFEQIYQQLLNTPSDINEHLPILFKYASQCESVLELGVRGVISSWALAFGLLNNNKPNMYLFLNDLEECDIKDIYNASKLTDLCIKFKWINDLELTVDRNFDLVFIDTWHVYGQLKRELNKFGKITNKYIIMHDTTIDEWEGETVRSWRTMNPQEQSLNTGIPIEEIIKGLWPAITEYLEENPDWKLKERYTNNNGLTILQKIY